jgi:hypothetical protein
VSGVSIVVVSAAFLAYGWYLALFENAKKDGALSCAAGAMLMPTALALAILPRRLLLVPAVIDGRPDEGPGPESLTRFTRVLQVLSFLAGVAMYKVVRDS